MEHHLDEDIAILPNNGEGEEMVRASGIGLRHQTVSAGTIRPRWAAWYAGRENPGGRGFVPRAKRAYSPFDPNGPFLYGS